MGALASTAAFAADGLGPTWEHDVAPALPRLRLLDPAGERAREFDHAAACAHRAWLAATRGTTSAVRCAAMAVDALADGTLLAGAWRGSGYHLCVGV